MTCALQQLQNLNLSTDSVPVPYALSLANKIQEQEEEIVILTDTNKKLGTAFTNLGNLVEQERAAAANRPAAANIQPPDFKGKRNVKKQAEEWDKRIAEVSSRLGLDLLSKI